MGKKRVVVGSISKRKDGSRVMTSTPYELKNLVDALKKADLNEKLYFNLESKAEQLKKLSEAVEVGRLDQEKADQIEIIIQKIPTFVDFQVALLVEA